MSSTTPIAQIVATNDEPGSVNRIHTADAVDYGFRGALVPAGTLYGYLTRACVSRWGRAWLERGGLKARFRRPVYDGDVLELCEERVGSGLRVTLRPTRPGAVPGRDDAVVGWGRLLTHPSAPAVGDYPTGRLPATPTLAAPDSLRGAGPLGPVVLDTRRDHVPAWLRSTVHSHSLYETLVPPAYFSAAPSLLAYANFRYDGPQVATEVQAQQFGTRDYGTLLEARGRVVDVRVHRGHHYRRVVALVVDPEDDIAVALVESEAIYRLARARTAADPWSTT